MDVVEDWIPVLNRLLKSAAFRSRLEQPVNVL